MAKYKMIADEIRRRIKSKVYEVSKPLPEQVKLAEEFHTSRVTIQKALDLLAVEGLVYSKQGSGTYVRKNAWQMSNLDSRADDYLGLTNKMANEGKISSMVISFQLRFPNEDECEKLIIEKNEPIYDIIRLRRLNDEPYLIEHTKMPVEVIPGLTEDILYKSIYTYIRKDLGLKIGGANRRIRADKPDELDQKYLECDKCDPVLEVNQVVYLDNGVPFEYSRTRHRYDKGDILVVDLNR
ncbi:GntR family transcriptional regulator [Weizmannia acidilactici]|uniref:GntR family transcriptional regulator n=1 Tax=Weizmannia acidilactici TaxID=2607726 RepID=A0A5J4JIH2_9BACI|nr:GntR family transcriptional regulator [Weizmannia acidilactici]GER70330.1 GntR family transcriptional regulator [Weizmannia acidilactici]GER73575.1 GntR family transcriptional regulator [Weizmannia acidilactici]